MKIKSCLTLCCTLLVLFSGPCLAGTVLLPGNLTVPVADADGTYKVSWGASKTAWANYILEEATNPTFTVGKRIVYTGPAIRKTISDRNQKTTYYYRVRSTKSGSTASAWRIGGNGCAVPGTVSAGLPGVLTIPTDSDGAYTVSWGDSAIVGVSYVLEEATNKTFTAGRKTVFTGKVTSKALTSRTPGETYYYRVRAIKPGLKDSAWRSGTNGCLIRCNTGSFSPVWDSGPCSEPTELSWRYRINGGNPLSTYVQGVSVTINFNDFLLTINPQSGLRNGSFSGWLSGNVTGNFSSSISDSLALSAGKTLITDQEVQMDMDLSVYGMSATVALNMMMDFTPAAEWFLDRSDLDQLPIGYVYNEQGSVNCRVSGSLAISGYSTITIPATNVSSPEIWTIIGKEASVVVGGTTYNDLVKVSRSTQVPNVDLSGGSQTMTITYWVAKGIGMVRGEGYLNLLGNKLTVELVETNLVP